MELHTLQLAPGARKKGKRIGRGQGSGKGGTSTKGHKGAQSRSGYKTKPHFEGGQNPLQRRIPKFGFTNPNKTSYVLLNFDDLNRISKKLNTTEITEAVLAKAGFVKKGHPYKILASGVLTEKVNVVADFFSKKAKQSIEAHGGTIITATK